MPPQMLRWSLLLSAYSYTLEYRPGAKHGNADALSRLPLPTPDYAVPPLGELLLLESTPDIILDASKIAQLTRTDPVLSRVMLWLRHGFPEAKEVDAFSPFLLRKNELSTHKDCLLWGSRLVVPERVRHEVLALLHNGHPGIVRMKALARSYIWWPGMDQDIESHIRQCEPCQLSRNNPPKAPVYNWDLPGNPWSRLHIDFAGPFMGKVFLIVVDAYSKWLEVCLMSSMSSQAVITKLRELFATHGIPDIVVSDNAAVFTSTEYLEFLKRNSVKAVRGAPYHPASNGQAERFVQSTKAALPMLMDGDWSTKIARFLFSQHTTPSSVTGTSPAELLMGRRLRTALDKLHPSLTRDIPASQTSSTTSRPTRQFSDGDLVYARNYTSDVKWIPARVTSRFGPLTYGVKIDDGRVWRRHIDQLRTRWSSDTQTPPDVVKSQVADHSPDEFWDFHLYTESTTTSSASGDHPNQGQPDQPPTVRRSTRQRFAPERYGVHLVHHSPGGGDVMYADKAYSEKRTSASVKDKRPACEE